MKKKILTIIGLIAVVAILATGAFAYFSAEATGSEGQITTGTMEILLASNTSSATEPIEFSDTVTPPWDVNLIVPDDEVFGCLWVKNTGDVETVGVRWDFKNLVNGTNVNLEDRLEITDLYTSDDVWDWPEAMLPGGDYYYDGAYDENDDGMISFGEFSRFSDLAPYTYDWQNDNPNAPFLELPPNEVGYICMNLKMMNGTPAEDNPYQGASLIYDVLVTGFNPQVAPTTP